MKKSKLFSGIVSLVCFAGMFVLLLVGLISAEREIDSMTAHALAQDSTIQEQGQIITAQEELLEIYRAHTATIEGVLEQVVEVLDGLAYGPYTRGEIQERIGVVIEAIEEINGTLKPDELKDMGQAIVHYSAAAGIDPLLLTAMAKVESNCRPGARGGSGEYGMLQVMPGTGRWIAGRLGYEDWQPEDMLDVKLNIEFAAFYLKSVTQDMGDTWSGVLAYNAGPGGARSWLKGNSVSAHDYVRKVQIEYSRLRSD